MATANDEKHNKKYTLKLKETYNSNITGDLKKKFDLFTNNIMNDSIINDYTLWYFAVNFQKQNRDMGLCRNAEWLRFTDMIFNYRPWQT